MHHNKTAKTTPSVRTVYLMPLPIVNQLNQRIVQVCIQWLCVKQSTVILHSRISFSLLIILMIMLMTIDWFYLNPILCKSTNQFMIMWVWQSTPMLYSRYNVCQVSFRMFYPIIMMIIMMMMMIHFIQILC